MWDNMMGWGGGGAMFGISHLIGWGLLIVALVVLVGRVLRGTGGGAGGHDRSLAILKERYARGEIDKTEFEERRRDLA